jgi:hypothetical protein
MTDAAARLLADLLRDEPIAVRKLLALHVEDGRVSAWTLVAVVIRPAGAEIIDRVQKRPHVAARAPSR